MLLSRSKCRKIRFSTLPLSVPTRGRGLRVMRFLHTLYWADEGIPLLHGVERLMALPVSLPIDALGVLILGE